MSQIFSNLYLGAYINAVDFKWLVDRKITHIVNLSQLPNIYQNNFNYLKIDIYDSETENISIYFNTIANFIEQALQQGGCVFVHCMAGISRSSTVLIAYLVLKRNLSLPDAINLVHRARPQINPNRGFLSQLYHYFGYQ